MFKLTKSQRKQLRKEKLAPVMHHKESIMSRGAAKILGLVSSHIYASKPE